MSINIPGADFTPQLAGYTGQGAFRFWCQKVLPIVYDDSLSYYELLNKVVNYLNNVIQDVSTVEDNVGEIVGSFNSLQQYVNDNFDEIQTFVNNLESFVNDYFDNLDVQNEIDHKLDEMVTDGTFDSLVSPVVVNVAPDIITEWLGEHITPTTPIVDDTLSIQGAAADAKATGDAIGNLSEALNDITGVQELPFTDGYYVTIATKGTTANLTPNANANSTYIIDNCKAGDVYVVWASPLSFSAGRTCMFLDTNNESLTVLTGAADLAAMRLVAPANGKFVLDADKTEKHIVYKGETDLRKWIRTNVDKTNNLFLAGSEAALLVPVIVEANTVYNTTNPEGVTLNNYKTNIYSVNSGDLLNIEVCAPTADKYKTALFYDVNNNLIEYIEPDRNEAVQRVVVNVPNGAIKMCISAASGAVPDITVKKYVYRGNQNDKFAAYYDGIVTIKTNDYIFSMKKRGNNNLFDLYEVSKADGTLIYQYSSDLMGPYVVEAINNADGDDQRATYTGGNHAYDYPSGTSGTPTAVTNAIKIYVDGTELTEGSSVAWDNEVIVAWTNSVQAWNTKKSNGTGRAVLKENPAWKFKPNGTIEVSNYIIALEDIQITLYYGLQLQAVWMDKGVFIPSATREFTDMSVFTPEGLGQMFAGFEMVAIDTDVIIKMGFDQNVDLGSGVGISSGGRDLRLHVNTSKLYTVMISSTDFYLDEDECATFCGYYKFINPKSLMVGEFTT